MFIATPRYLILVQLLKSSNSKRELQNEQKLVEGEVTMCVGSDSKVDKITIAHSLFPPGLVLELNKCYLVFALSINMIGSCLLRSDYSFKSENNWCSVYMYKTFYGLTSNVNGLLNLDHSDTHNIDAKRCNVNNDSASYLWHCRLGHIGVKRMMKLHADGLWNHLIMTHLMLANHALWAR